MPSMYFVLIILRIWFLWSTVESGQICWSFFVSFSIIWQESPSNFKQKFQQFQTDLLNKKNINEYVYTLIELKE